jgi:DNA-binding NarL/FixJ family response regulator
LVEQLRPTLVVMDLNMPKKNGIEATARIKARWPETVVIGSPSGRRGGTAGDYQRRRGGLLLTKEAAVDELYRTIRKSSTGR